MNTQENNKLIAEFMGGYTPYEKFGNNKEYYYRGKYVNLDDMEFNSSWDWLMPVVEKMNTTELWDEYDISHLATYLVSVDINATYKAVVEFINQYNKTK